MKTQKEVCANCGKERGTGILICDNCYKLLKKTIEIKVRKEIINEIISLLRKQGK